MNEFLHTTITNGGVWVMLGAILLTLLMGALGGLVHRIIANREADYRMRQLRYNYQTLEVGKRKEIEGYEIN